MKKFAFTTVLGLLASLSSATLAGQTYTFGTLAGVAPGSADGTGDAARFFAPLCAAVDSAGNVYVADTNNHTIRKITPAGVVTTLAGTAGSSGSADGTGSTARFKSPEGVAVDGSGNVYVVDVGNVTIRKITPGGVVTTFAGTVGVHGVDNAPISSALFDHPTGIAVDSAGTVYVVESSAATIRKITTDGWVTTVAGYEFQSGSADGTGNAARFSYPTAVAVDGVGNLYVADTGNRTVRKVTAAGVVTTFAGTAGTFGSTDGTGSAARFYYPRGVAVDSAGNVCVADGVAGTIRKITSDGVVTTFVGTVFTRGSMDGVGAAAQFIEPNGMAADGAGNLYVTDDIACTVRKITAGGTVTTIAGSPTLGNTDGAGAAARFNDPRGVAVDNAGTVYVADRGNFTIRKITTAGVITTLAGAAGTSGSADGTGSAARFGSPFGVAVDGAGNLYVVDAGYHTIRKITSEGVVTTLAGLAGSSGSADGTGNAARFNRPQGVAVDGAGNVYVADRSNRTIRKITAEGVVTTFAGTVNTSGTAYSTDGTGAAAAFVEPNGLALDAAGNIYVADFNTIRKITPAGVVTTFAGYAGSTGSADGTGEDARFNYPTGVAVDGAGNIFVANCYGYTIRKITPDRVVTTIAGVDGGYGSFGSADGAGTAARFYNPFGVAVDHAGNVYVADSSNNTIRIGFAASGAFSGDFDGDGRAEPLWHSSNTGDIHVWFLAGGSVTYGNEGGGWSVIGSGDFDGDGRAEPLWHSTNTGDVRVWFLAGGSVTYGNEGGGWSVIGSGDFDGDGRTEPLWRNANTGDIHVWFLAGGSVTYGNEGDGWAVIGVGDFDGDGWAEPLWHNTTTGDVRVWFLAGGSVSYGIEGDGWAVIGVGDFDGDGRAEPLWHNTTTGDVRVWFLAGGSVTYGSEGGGWSAIGSGDFDGDGRTEPLWRNANTGDIHVWFLAGGSVTYGNEGGGWQLR